MTNEPTLRSTVIPSMRYRDARAAIEWLTEVLGFEKHAIYTNPDGTVLHAELTLGGGMIMLGSAVDSPYGRLMQQPDEIGKRNTHSLNLVAPDPDAIYQRAKAAGAEIVSEIQDQSYGGRSFGFRDPEGHLWHVGSYDPWQLK
jgi:uncharacterized glyoxalase superfamily protein PhnB